MSERDEIDRAVSDAEQASSAGDHAAAEQALRRALRLQEARFGLVHPEVANTLNNLGVVCDILGRPSEAEFLYRRALGLARRTLPPDHPYIATSLQNLSTLYRAQGKTDKLASVADIEVSRSGLPPTDPADDADREAEASEGTADVATPPQSRPRSPYDQLVHPAVLMAATATILLSIGWLFFGGSPGEEGAGPDEPVARATAPGSGERDVVADPPRETASADPDPALSVDQAPPGVESGSADPTALESVDPDPIADEAGFASVVVVEASVCSRLVTRGEDGAPLDDWRCEPVVDVAAPGQLYFITRIRSSTSLTVEHLWSRDGVLDREIDLDIGANTGLGYRTYSSRTVLPQERGAWRVELRSKDQEVLQVVEFVVR